ncbi:sodium:solute symporter [Botrimarina mediterranea]|uniref:Sodium/glucose cotransporter n=1 Tax=Botrimarina mediterranea TaxID=2528022 RepID=A0A518KBI1_9BACT|nr:sodium:solute symporter [Botrimarina mediterranea]QDV75157.1 Sodium/glucose cotransporter [Botrimarina mediterranea]QDV79803.1 Sodium/glucose cotransporter [Planctomycetes bacterium K2D]
METLDWAVIGGYFAIILGLAWWVIRQKNDTSEDYFLAGHSLGWFIVGASIFASNIGSEHLVGLAGSGATDGVAMAHYELHAWCLLVLGWILVPFYARSRVFTMPEFLERRFSPAARYTLSIISLVAYVVTKIAVGIYAGGIVFSVLLPELTIGPLNSFWIGSLIVLVLTGVYTTLGGFRAVAYTETLQTVVLIVGSALVTYYGLQAIGGWEGLRDTIGDDKFNLWKPLTAVVDGKALPFEWAPVEETNDAGQLTRQAWYFNGNYPWLGMLFCAPIIGLWYWCTDQYIVQRALGAENETEARRGSIFAALLKLLPVFIFIVPGMICMGLVMKSQSGEIDNLDFAPMMTEDGSEIEDSGKAFPMMVQNVLPTGIRGLVVAGLLSALMSSLAGVFNACSTLFTIDLYQKFAPLASEKRLVQVGRMATVAMVLIGMAWIPVIQGSKGLYDYLQSVQGYLAPPIFVVFFLGIAWKRLNAAGCMAALLVGFALGLFRMGVDTPSKIYPGFEYPAGSLLWIVNKIYFQYFSLIITLVSAAAMILVSYLTSPPNEAQISGLTYGAITEEDKARTRESWGTIDVITSCLVMALILGAYIYFSG